MKSSHHFGFAIISLLLIAMAQATHAQQSTGGPQDLSQMGCRQIAVIGAVRSPSRLDAPLRLSLLEVLVRVGGPNERAGKTISVIHSCKCSPCDKLDPKADASEYNLADVLRDRASGNPYVAPGDIVIVPEAASVFVIGNAYFTGRSLRFSEGMTVTRAIAMAGGVNLRIRSSDLVVVRIYRSSSGAPRQDPIIVNLRSILKRGTEDVLLQPWDIVEVSDESGNFRVPRMSPPSWDPPPPKSNPPLPHRRETSGSTLITAASWRGSIDCIDSALL